MRRTLMLLGAVVFSTTVPLDAQSIRGRLLDTETDAAIAGGTVILLSEDSVPLPSVLSDEAGSFVRQAPDAGGYRLYAQRLGYRSAASPVIEMEARDTLTVEYRLSTEAVLLRPVTVVAYTGRPDGVLGGFYERMERGAFGTFISREQIEQRHPIYASDLLRTIPVREHLRSSRAPPRDAQYHLIRRRMERRDHPRVRAIEHTADLAIEVEAASLPALFDGAATGMLALIEREDLEGAIGTSGGADPIDRDAQRYTGAVVRELELGAPDLPSLLVHWLRELLHLFQGEQLAYRGAEFHRLTTTALRAAVRTEPAVDAVREIKGVTYHDLEVSHRDSLWHTRVVFDV
jgi:SHS2 domain-containing protein